MSLALHEIAETSHRILNPLTDSQLMTVGQVSRVGPATRVLDLACGKGELLCRWAQEFGASGVGRDLSQVFITAARARAAELATPDRVVFEHGDARERREDPGSFDVVSCIGASWIGGGVAGTIELMRPAVDPAGLLLIGEPYWVDPPPHEAYDAIGCEPEEFLSLAGLLERFEAARTDLVEMVLADGASWDRYAAAQWWNLHQWLDRHADDALAPDVRDFLFTSRRAYLAYQRRYLGWGVFVLRTA